MAPPPAHYVCHLPRSGRGGWRYAPSPCGVLVLKCEYYHANNTEENRFRPLAGSLYLSFPRHYGGSGEQREPMGALVPCVHFWRYEDLQLAFMAPLPPLTRSPSPALAGEALGYNGIIASPVATGEVASNASRWGRLCLACTSVAMDGLQLASMAPPPAHCVCHLPRSGRGGWWYAPSPCGVLVLKCACPRKCR